MSEKELIAMASFRIGEASRYLRMLAVQAESPALQRWLLSTARDLGDQVARAQSILAEAEKCDDPASAVPRLGARA